MDGLPNPIYFCRRELLDFYPPPPTTNAYAARFLFHTGGIFFVGLLGFFLASFRALSACIFRWQLEQRTTHFSISSSIAITLVERTMLLTFMVLVLGFMWWKSKASGELFSPHNLQPERCLYRRRNSKTLGLDLFLVVGFTTVVKPLVYKLRSASRRNSKKPLR